MDIVFAVEGLSDLDIENAPERLKRLAAKAITHSLRKTRTASAREMREQVNFSARYLTGRENGRLMIATFPKSSDLVGRLRGRDRPTSLARFTKQKPRTAGTRSRRRGVRVTVKPNSPVQMERAFLMKLRGNNVGLAVRTENGQPPSAAYSPKYIGNNLYLLYGPSVDQVFRSVREDVSDVALEEMEKEFLRLSEALL